MSTKFLHVRAGYVVAVSFPDEPINAYGELKEVPADLEIGVGDPAPADAPEAEPVARTRRKAAAE